MVEWPGGRVVKVTGRGNECHDGPQVDHLGPHMEKINFAQPMNTLITIVLKIIYHKKSQSF